MTWRIVGGLGGCCCRVVQEIGFSDLGLRVPVT